MKKPFSLVFAMLFMGFTNAQNVGIGTNSPVNSAKLEVSSTTQGFLPPRMTEVHRNAIVSPATGLVIFNTSTNSLNVYVGNAWLEVKGLPSYSAGTVPCSNTSTTVADVLNPATGRTWMDRNLGASRAPTSSTDSDAYGDLYQWGRMADGHQCLNSATTSSISSSDQPPNGNFIMSPSAPNNWRIPQNTNLWQGINGINNPCPSGYRLPSRAELDVERGSWVISNASGAFASPLKFTMAGYRSFTDGSYVEINSSGNYWSNSFSNGRSFGLIINSSTASVSNVERAQGYSVRCIKEMLTTQSLIQTLDCSAATTNGTLSLGIAASGVSTNVPYTGGNGGSHMGQTVISTGVSGLTATLAPGNFANGAGSLLYNITGTPTSSGTARFALYIGGQTCTFSAIIPAKYPVGTVHCTDIPTEVVNVMNPNTGKIWMDRNLGASRAATSSTDANSYGDLYQWGRKADGHQCRNSGTTSILSTTNQPANGNFILVNSGYYDWRDPQNPNLWQGVNGINNPCPIGYRVPTSAELNAELGSWGTNNASGGFASPLKLPMAGVRNLLDGSFNNVGTNGSYWSGKDNSVNSLFLGFNGSTANIDANFRAAGLSVRCIKD
jgi:uncharacterized protein (TIGR02145 family)